MTFHPSHLKLIFPPTATPAGYAAEPRTIGQSSSVKGRSRFDAADASPEPPVSSGGEGIGAALLRDAEPLSFRGTANPAPQASSHVTAARGLPFPAPTAPSPDGEASSPFVDPYAALRRGVFPQDHTHPQLPRRSETREAVESSSLNGAAALPASSLSIPSHSSHSSHPRKADWSEAEATAKICREFLRLRHQQHYSLNQAARALDKSPSYFSGAQSVLARYQRHGVAGLLPRRGETGSKPEIELPHWFIPAAKFYYLLTNRTRTRGSAPEAIRRVLSLPHTPPHWDHKVKARLLAAINAGKTSSETLSQTLPTCPPELRAQLLARERAGLPFLPARLMRQIPAAASTVQQYRHQKNAALDYLNSPGSLMWITRPDGAKEFIRAGDILEADDGTINLPCVVPWTIGGCPSSNNYGVKVGRFQFLRAIDAGSRFRPGYSYVMRPRGSYRQEDILALLLQLMRRWGKWNTFRFERGSWKGNRIQEICRLLGITLDTVYSPHSKAFVEGGFNQDWTKLSPYFPGVDLGRFMGETDQVTQLVLKCQQGKEDGAKHFPLLSNVLSAFDAITAEEILTPINSPNYGRWIPQERWDAQLAQRPMPALDPETAWLFAPWVRQWTVKGMQVGGKVALFEQLSVPFDFSADWLPKFHGAKVRCYFDPHEARCQATIVLAQNWGAHRADEVLGTAVQINEVAGYARLVMGWGDDPATAGLKARQQAAAALRREVRTIMPHGKRSQGTTEIRDGIATVVKAEISAGPSEPAVNTSQECVRQRASSVSEPMTSPPRAGAAAENPGSAPEKAQSTITERRARAAQFETENPAIFA